ncbi:PilZ domain-containing protein [Desulfacinum hydrothermale DSM 13146]|uniref:PilZ domain-containing protein n=1 Tax=Desulfacinum hydrothermale DSM 13146 TaxID=1121390 RepID=A0A1W1XR25_9BACT|nr:PilZ domain-containing protein [Desulfacinum hydrothermale]SMC26413.1 PilZ domain-containing protein [Desulfacinum hydrothermale DSM 13146]
MGATNGVAASGAGGVKDRRKHFRIPVRLPAHVTELDEHQSYAASLVDLSLRGLGIQSLAARSPQPGTRVLLGVALNGDVVNVTGTICWTSLELKTPEDKPRCGIQLDEELQARIPVRYAIKICEEFDGEVERARRLRERFPLIAHGIRETYPWSLWGRVVGALSEAAQSHWASCAARVELSAYRAEKLRSSQVADPEAVDRIVEDLKRTGSNLRALATMFRAIRDKHLALSQNSGYLVDLEQAISDSVKSLQEALAGLTEAPLPAIMYEKSPLPLVFGKHRDFVVCFDGLLAFSFRSAFYNKGSRILVQSRVDDHQLILSILEDGARALDRNLLELTPEGILDLESFSQRDLRAALWLYCALVALEDHEPRLQVRSESGRNQLRLVLPLEPTIKKPTQATRSS